MGGGYDSSLRRYNLVLSIHSWEKVHHCAYDTCGHALEEDAVWRLTLLQSSCVFDSMIYLSVYPHI